MKCLSVENFRGMLFNVNELAKTGSMLRICKKGFYFTSQTIPKNRLKSLPSPPQKFCSSAGKRLKKVHEEHSKFLHYRTY